jgi:hypothetical protein
MLFLIVYQSSRLCSRKAVSQAHHVRTDVETAGRCVGLGRRLPDRGRPTSSPDRWPAPFDCLSQPFGRPRLPAVRLRQTGRLRTALARTAPSAAALANRPRRTWSWAAAPLLLRSTPRPRHLCSVGLRRLC